MKKPTWKQYAFWIGLSEAVGGLSALLTREGQKIYNATANQPPLSPPQWVFPVVWGSLYALMGVSAARIAVTEERPGLNFFAAQLTVNFFWSLLFFNAQAYGFASLWLALLIALVIGMILRFRKSGPAGRGAADPLPAVAVLRAVSECGCLGAERII